MNLSATEFNRLADEFADKFITGYVSGNRNSRAAIQIDSLGGFLGFLYLEYQYQRVETE